MPLWRWHRSCCGGTPGDDDNSSLDQQKIHLEVVTQGPSRANDANSSLLQAADENEAAYATSVNSSPPTHLSDDMERAKKEKLLSSPKNFQMLTVIGDGSYGGIGIWLSKCVPLNRYVAVKKIDVDQCELPISLTLHEINMHRLLRHKNILSISSCFVVRNEVWMVLPLKAYGSCQDLLRAHFKFGLPEMAIAFILKDVLRALEYLHSRSVIHRDIKASHIFVHSDGRACLSGLRHCLSMISNGRRLKRVHNFPHFYSNSLNWASPELLEQNLDGYDTKSDIYSCGITACELANGMVPFQDMPLTQMLVSKIEGTMPRLLDISTIPELQNKGEKCGDLKEAALILKNLENFKNSGDVEANTALLETLSPYRRAFSEHFHNFVELSLAADQKSRPSAVSLSAHSFFKQILPKSKPASLTELLKPLNPIAASTIPALADNPVDSLANGIGVVALDAEWSF